MGAFVRRAWAVPAARAMLLALLVAALRPAGPARAQGTFQEPAGHFILEIPSAYALISPRGGPFYQFRADPAVTERGPQFVVLFHPDEQNLSAAFEQGLAILNDSLLETVPVGALQDLMLNGHPARMGLYTGQVRLQGNGLRVQLFAFVGCAVLNGGSAVYLTFMNPMQREKWEPGLRRVFFSLRNVGEPLQGAQDVHPHLP
jgi:hypothetical protein